MVGVTASWVFGFLKWGRNVLELDSGAGCTTSQMQQTALKMVINHALCIPHNVN